MVVFFIHQVDRDAGLLIAAGKHGLNLSYLARNVEVLIYLVAPVIALCGLTWITRRDAIVSWMKRQAAFVTATVVTIGMVSIVTICFLPSAARNRQRR